MQRASYEFEGVVRLTSIGGWYVLFTFFIGFAAINTGNNSLYIALAFMLSSLIISGYASKGGLKHVSVTVGKLGETWAGKPSDGLLIVENRSRIWNVRDIIITSPDLAEPLFLPLIVRRTTMEVPARFVFQRRGRVEISRADLYTRYPFGLFMKKRRVRLQGQAIVYPRLLSSSDVPVKFDSIQGQEISSNNTGHGSEIFAFRDYVRGDSLRNIHWKKSASLGRWIMKQPNQESNRSITVAFDPYLSSESKRESFEHMVSAAATFIREALDAGHEIRLITPDGMFVAREERGRKSLFEALALIEPVSRPLPAISRDTVMFTMREQGESQIA